MAAFKRVPSDTVPDSDVTQLLHNWQQGEPGALDDLLPVIYDDFSRIAASYMMQQRSNHTLQPTALVNEAYMRMQRRYKVPFESRSHFLAATAKAMRNILVDHARKQNADKRFNPSNRVTLVEIPSVKAGQDLDILALNQALERLARISERQAQVVELRYFAGLTESEAADVLGVSAPTVRRDWKVARATLRHWLTDPEEV